MGPAKKRYEGELFDLHLHILPNVDDGAASLDESIKMARQLSLKNIRYAVATPHYVTGTELSGEGYIGKVRTGYHALVEKLEADGIAMTLSLGFEVRAGESLLYSENPKALVIGSSPFLLLEAPFYDPCPWLEDLLYTLQLWAIKPILAHPERCAGLSGDRMRLERIVASGIPLQLNLGSLTGTYGRGIRRSAQHMLQQGLFSFVGSDAHSSQGCELSEAVGSLLKSMGREKSEVILCRNALACFQDFHLK